MKMPLYTTAVFKAKLFIHMAPGPIYKHGYINFTRFQCKMAIFYGCGAYIKIGYIHSGRAYI